MSRLPYFGWVSGFRRLAQESLGDLGMADRAFALSAMGNVMPIPRHLDCPVHLGDQPPAGAFANAFRILSPEENGDCVLEFLIFSPNAQKAYVVRRVRIRREFMPVVLGQIATSLTG